MLWSTPVPQFEFQKFLARVSIVCRLFFMRVCSVPPARSHLFFKRDRDLQQPNAYWKPERDSAVSFTGVIQHLFQIRRGKLLLHRFCFNPIIYTTDYYYCLWTLLSQLSVTGRLDGKCIFWQLRGKIVLFLLLLNDRSLLNLSAF